MIIYLYLFLIFLTIIFKIRGFIFAFLLLIILGIFHTIPWFNKNSIINHSECLIGTEKKINGVIFNGCLDYWHVAHVILYILIGLLYPNDYLFVLVISIIWEVYEHFMFKYIIKKSNCNENSCLRIEDIFLNLFGYFIGSLWK
jgi:hypothetical protein